MASVGDKYVLILESRDPTLDPIGTNPLLNVFAYEATSGTPSANDLYLAFESVVVPTIAAIIANTSRMVRIDVVNLDDGGDFDFNTILETGTGGVAPLPLFTSWTFRYNRATRAVHNGRKAFGAISETQVNNGAAEPAFVATLTAAANALGTVLVGAGGDYTPRIWRRAGTYQVGGVPTVFIDTFYPIVGVTYTNISTQNSRKG